MSRELSDIEITQLLSEEKKLPVDYRSRLSTRQKRSHHEAELEVQGSAGSVFRVIVRRSILNNLDFSVILGYELPKTNRVFRLRRYNGKSHEHTNKIENTKFYDFHIHKATYRYQQFGMREDSFAEISHRYSDLAGAIECLISDCGFELPVGENLSLFE